MIETDLQSANVITDAFRTIFASIDNSVYSVLGACYQLFFNVASADLFSNQTIMKFYGRVQVILGVFMLFELSLTILKGIVNPDSFTGDKGARAIITRIVTALVLLTLLMPINIPSPKNEYEIQVNNNGILFGTIYSLQHRILSNNTIGKLILGSTDNDMGYRPSLYSDSDLEKSSRVFTSTILKGFYRINLIPEEARDDRYLKEGKDPATYNENRVCKDISDDVLYRYTRIDATPSDITSLVNETCIVDNYLINSLPVVSSFIGTKKYAFIFMPVISAIVGFIFVFVLIKFTVDIAVRSVKLVVLRLIAPIPIISYMDPNGAKDGSFNAWVKALTSTYVDLFIRLAVVYFVIFLIQEMIVHGIVIDAGEGPVMVFSMIAIFIGLFIFANQAPKFIKQILGMKSDGTPTIGNILGKGLAFGTAAAGMVGSARANYRASKEENAELHKGQNVRNGFRNAGSAIAGAIGGAYTGFRAASAKDATARKVMDAQSQRNARRASHSTFPGRIADDVYGMFSGRSLADRDQAQYDVAKKAVDALNDLKSTAETEALKQKNFYGDYKGSKFNYEALSAALSRARAAGAVSFKIKDNRGVEVELTTDELDANVLNDIKASQTAAYMKAQKEGKGYDGTTRTFVRNNKLLNKVTIVDKVVREAGYDTKGTYTDPETKEKTTYDAYDGSYDSIGKTIGRASDTVMRGDTNMRTIKHRANARNKK